MLGNQPGLFRSDEDDPEVKLLARRFSSNCAVLLQLILHIAFNQVVKVHSIAIEAPEDKGPKTVKLFVNRQAIDFNDAKRSEAVQTLESVRSTMFVSLVSLCP